MLDADIICLGSNLAGDRVHRVTGERLVLSTEDMILSSSKVLHSISTGPVKMEMKRTR